MDYAKNEEINIKIKLMLQDLLEHDEDYEFFFTYESSPSYKWVLGQKIEGNWLEITTYCDLHCYFIFTFRDGELFDIKMSGNCGDWDDPQYWSEEEAHDIWLKMKELKNKINNLL